MSEATETTDLTSDVEEETTLDDPLAATPADAAGDGAPADEPDEAGAEPDEVGDSSRRTSPYVYTTGDVEEDVIDTSNPIAAALREAELKAAREAEEAKAISAILHKVEEEPEAVAPESGEAPEPAEAAEAPEAAEAKAKKAEKAKKADKADKAVEVEAAEEEAPEEEYISPYDKPGDWYVVHSYSGYENKVKANLMTRTQSMHMEDRIFEVVIPMEKVVEIKNGQRVEVPKKMFPGYILVRMYLDDDSWYAVRNTPGVTGFVGGGNKPTPLSRREVERFLGTPKPEEKKAPRFKPAWEIGETVRVVAGPFADFNGVIEDINIDQQKVTVLVSIFGRDTPMELNFEDIQKQ